VDVRRVWILQIRYGSEGKTDRGGTGAHVSELFIAPAAAASLVSHAL